MERAFEALYSSLTESIPNAPNKNCKFKIEAVDTNLLNGPSHDDFFGLVP
jgi:hypothetical protein